MAGKGKPGPVKGDPRNRENGRKGGEAAKAAGLDYARIGKAGGDATLKKHGPGHFAEIGSKGGKAVGEVHGADFYSTIGKAGGKSGRGASKVRPKKP